MLYQLPDPYQLKDDPALAVFALLAVQLEVASFTLLGAHPELRAARLENRTTRSERDAYASVVSTQIQALRDTLAEYIASGRRLRDRKSRLRRNRAQKNGRMPAAEKPLF